MYIVHQCFNKMDLTAPRHFATRVGDFLNEKFHNRWIARGGPLF